MTIALFCDDEAIAVRASVDFVALCPRDQRFAAGSDGSFTALDRWTLLSAAVADFVVRGVTPGCVVALLKPAASFRPPGELLVVAGVSTGGALTLRRKGLDAGAGDPPAPAGGLTGVEFTVPTFTPQVRRASYDLYRRFGIDDKVPGRQVIGLYDPIELRDVTVVTVLAEQYAAAARLAGTQADDFAAKYRLYASERDDLLARLTLHWKQYTGAGVVAPATTHFSTRLSR